MDKIAKRQAVEELSAVFKNNSGVLLLDFTGVNVAQETELRRRISDAGCGYRVIKNTLAKIAARDGGAGQLDEYFRGPTAVAFTEDNPVVLAKALTEFVKAHPTTSLKCGLLDDSVLSVQEVQDLADLPSREELLAKLVYLLQAPLMQLASALQTPLRNLASQLSQLEEKKAQQ